MKTSLAQEAVINPVKQSARQFAGILPIPLEVVLLIGMFNALIQERSWSLRSRATRH